MTQSTETVTQRAREAAVDLMHEVRGYRVGLPNDGHFAIQAFARFERELSTNKDETIAKLREALDGMVRRHSASLQNWTQAAADAQQSGNRELCVSIQNAALTALSGFPLAQARAALTSTEKEG